MRGLHPDNVLAVLVGPAPAGTQYRSQSLAEHCAARCPRWAAWRSSGRDDSGRRVPVLDPTETDAYRREAT
jgi:hypothetical protein